MSSAPETRSARRGPLVVAAGLLAAFLLSSLVNALIAVPAHQLFNVSESFDALQPRSYGSLTAMGVLAGATGWAVVRKLARDPENLLRRLVPTVLVISFVPDFFQVDKGGAAGVMALMLMHVVITVIAVATYRRVMPVMSLS